MDAHSYSRGKLRIGLCENATDDPAKEEVRRRGRRTNEINVLEIAQDWLQPSSHAVPDPVKTQSFGRLHREVVVVQREEKYRYDLRESFSCGDGSSLCEERTS